MTEQPAGAVVQKLPTGIPSFDIIAKGGLPRNRTTLISGTAGSGKTIFAVQFLAAGIRDWGESGVFVTFEESPADVRTNMRSFGWDLDRWEREGKLAFVDASPDPDVEVIESGSFDLGALLARIEHAVRKVGATRVSVDSLGAIFTQFSDQAVVRRELFRIASALKGLGVTAILTAERANDYGPVARFEVEEFITDNVVILRNVLEDENRRRTIEILKFRGTDHQKGEFPFTIVPSDGLVVIPLSAIQLEQGSSDVRVTSGNAELDSMCGGGFFRDSVVLVSGATGTGKTLLVTQFMNGGFREHERSLLFAFEESRDQLFRNAKSWGMDFEKAQAEGTLLVVNQYPHAMPMEDHLVRMRDTIAEYQPQRVAVDSLSALERVFSLRSFREFVISLTSTLKQQSITTLFTSTTPTLLGGGSVTEKHISTLTDSIVLLRYVETLGRMRRSINVLKMRGSSHDATFREVSIDGTGMRIGEPFSDVSGILTGHPQLVLAGDVGDSASSND